MSRLTLVARADAAGLEGLVRAVAQQARGFSQSQTSFARELHRELDFAGRGVRVGRAFCEGQFMSTQFTSLPRFVWVDRGARRYGRDTNVVCAHSEASIAAGRISQEGVRECRGS